MYGLCDWLRFLVIFDDVGVEGEGIMNFKLLTGRLMNRDDLFLFFIFNVEGVLELRSYSRIIDYFFSFYSLFFSKIIITCCISEHASIIKEKVKKK